MDWSFFSVHLAMKRRPEYRAASFDPEVSKAWVVNLGYSGPKQFNQDWKDVRSVAHHEFLRHGVARDFGHRRDGAFGAVVQTERRPRLRRSVMREPRIHRIPVVDDKEAVVGTVSLSDIARYLFSIGDGKVALGTQAEVTRTLAAICEPRTNWKCCRRPPERERCYDIDDSLSRGRLITCGSQMRDDGSEGVADDRVPDDAPVAVSAPKAYGLAQRTGVSP